MMSVNSEKHSRNWLTLLELPKEEEIDEDEHDLVIEAIESRPEGSFIPEFAEEDAFYANDANVDLKLGKRKNLDDLRPLQ